MDTKRRHFGIAALCALVLVLAAPGPASSRGRRGPAPPPPLEMAPVPAPPVIDGRLDDAVWANAVRFEGFKTFKPDFGKEPSQRTEAYFSYDPDNFYFAVRCHDTEPGKIKSSVCKRDDMGQDDMVGILLDTFNDNQNAYAFMINPLGIQGDGIMNVQGNVDASHDLVWYSKGVIDGDGWAVEARVPLQSLRYPGGKFLVMGCVFFRFHTRTSEQFCYPPLDPSNSNIMSQAQPIRVGSLHRRRVVEALPAFTYGARHEAREGALRKTEEDRDFGFTGKVGLTSDLTLDGAYNPDFSQVEADAGQVDINLRYALYYPEKRPFFLEGQDIWMFGGTQEDSPLQAVVYTRTIVDPSYGFRLTGKVGPRDTVAAIYARDEQPGDALDERPDFTIVRYKHALRGDSYIGGFYTGREAGPGHNRVGGADGRLRLNRTWVLSFHAFGALTRREAGDPASRDHALGLTLNHQSREWFLDLGFQDISPGFQVDSGFITRTGLKRLGGFLQYQIYPRSRLIQKIEPFYWGYQLYDTTCGMWETFNMFVARFSLPRNIQVRFEGILGNEIFAGRRFDRNGYGFRFQGQVTRQVYLESSYRQWGGIYYDPDAPYQGDETRAALSVRYQPLEKIDLGLSLDTSRFRRREGGEKVYDYTILRSRNTYQVNPYLYLRAIVEYNFYRKRLTADGLVSFTYIPGTVFYVGYGSAYERLDWRNGEYVDGRRFLETKRGFFLKVSYLWRF